MGYDKHTMIGPTKTGEHHADASSLEEVIPADPATASLLSLGTKSAHTVAAQKCEGPQVKEHQ